MQNTFQQSFHTTRELTGKVRMFLLREVMNRNNHTYIHLHNLAVMCKEGQNLEKLLDFFHQLLV